MSLTIHTEEDNQQQMIVTVKVSEERVQQAMRSAARELAKDVNVPGFRKGKAPYQVILRRVGEEALRAEAIEKLAQPIFEEMMDETGLEPYAQVSLDDIEDKPAVFKFTVPLAPSVTLGAYRELRREVDEVEVTDEAVAEALERVRARHQVVEDVERPLEPGDVVVLSGTGRLLSDDDDDDDDEEAWDESESAEEFDESELDDDDEDEYDDDEDEYDDDEDEYDDDEDYEDILFDEDNLELVLDAKTLFPETPFIENLVGLSAGDSKTFTFTFPEAYEDDDLAGREASFAITVKGVKSRTLPDLDDELARKEGSYETLDELRTSLRQSLQEEAEREANNTLIEQMIDDLLKEAVIAYPPAAVEREIDEIIESLKNQVTRSGWAWEDYLQIQRTDEAEMREQFRDSAVNRLTRQLTINEFIRSEKLRITEEDLDAQLEKRLSLFPDEAMRENMRQYLQSEYGNNLLGSEILVDKIAARIKAILRGEAPDLTSLEVDDAPEGDEEE